MSNINRFTVNPKQIFFTRYKWRFFQIYLTSVFKECGNWHEKKYKIFPILLALLLYVVVCNISPSSKDQLLLYSMKWRFCMHGRIKKRVEREWEKSTSFDFYCCKNNMIRLAPNTLDIDLEQWLFWFFASFDRTKSI